MENLRNFLYLKVVAIVENVDASEMAACDYIVKVPRLDSKVSNVSITMEDPVISCPVWSLVTLEVRDMCCRLGPIFEVGGNFNIVHLFQF